MRHLGFTLLEFVFVIVIMGILSKFGFEFLAQAYKSFIYSNINNTLQAQSATAVESIASRLQYRIKDSVIARKSTDFTSFEAVGSVPIATATEYNVLEWVGWHVDGFRGDTTPFWSGIIDLDASSSTVLNSPETNTTAINNLILALRPEASLTTVNNAALYFIGSDSDVKTGYGWDGVALADHNTSVMHRINSSANIYEFTSGVGGVDFSGTDIYEYYQLSWTAYAIVHSADNNLYLHYDYQPWEGERYTDGKSELIMQNVGTFRFKATGSIVKIQVCVKSDIIDGNEQGGYSLCKEKTIF